MSAYPSSTPESEPDLKRALEENRLPENHYFDAKQEYKTTPGDRKEAAADMASFAIDGGAIGVGIHEDKKSRTFTLHPVALDGLPERLEQIARSRVDPPLFVECTTIATEDDPSRGYVWVSIPPSAQSPHQVEGRYYGRGDSTKHYLSDAEVARLHAARVSDEASTARLIETLVGRDLIPAHTRSAGQMFLVSEPTVANTTAARRFLQRADSDVRMELLNMVINDDGIALDQDDYSISPTTRYLGSSQRRRGGIALVNNVTTEKQWAAERVDDASNALLDVEFTSNGGVESVVGHASRNSDRPDGTGYVNDRLIALYVRRQLRWTAKYAAMLRYRGMWRFGVHIDHLDGRASSSRLRQREFGYGIDGHSGDTYRQMTSASTAEIEQEPWVVAKRLVGDLMWTLGCQQYTSHLLDAPAQT